MTPGLTKIKNHLKAKKQKGLALDIDETLSWTLGYWVEQLQIRFGNPENFSIEEIITKYRYTQNIPYWQTKEALAWMEEARNTDKLHEKFPLIKDSNLIVKKINKIIPIVVYLTTRPQSVIQGTRKWLKKHSFPQVDIIAKPNNIPFEENNEWKAEVLEFLYPEIIGIIDDNPELVDRLSSEYQGTVYLYNSVASQRQDISVIPCKTWEDVLSQIKNFNKFEQKPLLI